MGVFNNVKLFDCEAESGWFFFILGRWELCAYNIIQILCLCLGHHFESSHAQAALAIYNNV